MAVSKRTYKRKHTKDGQVWYYQFRLNGHRYVASGFTTEREAKEAERKKINELKSKRSRPVPRETATFDQWLPRFLEHRRVMGKSPRTVENERRRGNVLKAAFGDRSVRDITVADIQAHVAARLDDGTAHRTVNLELTFLRTFFRHAVQNHASEMNPAREVPNLPAQEHEEVWIPTEEEFNAFVRAAEQTATGRYMVPWIRFRALTGCRPSESFHLEWSDVDFRQDRIWFRPKNGHPLKNRKRRYVPMHADLKPVLLAWRTQWEELYAKWRRREQRESVRRKRGPKPDHDWVFICPGNHGARANGYRRSFYEARSKAGLPKFNSYTLRHHFISRCIMSGIDFYTIARWVGHKGTRMIEEVYGHLTRDYSAEQMAKLRVVPERAS